MPLEIRKKVQLTGHKASIFTLAPDQPQGFFLSGAGDGWLVRWNLDDPETGKLIAQVETQVFSMTMLTDRQVVVVGNMNGGVHWVDLKEPEKTKNIAHHQKGVFEVRLIGQRVYTIGGQGVLTRWDVDSARSLESIQLTNQSLRSLDYSAQRGELAIGSSDNCIYLLDEESLQIKRKLFNAHENSVFSIRYHPKKPLLLSGARDAHLKAWELDGSFPCVYDQPAHWFTINELVFSPNGQWIATASRDKTIKIWDAGTFELVKVLETVRDKGHINSVNTLFWSPYQNELISAGDDRSIIIWSVEE